MLKEATTKVFFFFFCFTVNQPIMFCKVRVMNQSDLTDVAEYRTSGESVKSAVASVSQNRCGEEAGPVKQTR